MSGIYTYRSGEFLRIAGGGSHRRSLHRQSRSANVVQYGCVSGAAGLYADDSIRISIDGITGPIFWNVDGTVSKIFPIRERYKLEFRFEAYNLTNSLMWANPNLSLG